VITTRALLSLVLLGVWVDEAGASERPRDHDAWLRVAAAPRAADGPVVVASHEPGRGAPALLWAPGAAAPGLGPEAAARALLDRHRASYGVSREALAGLRLRFVHDTGRGGIVVGLRQTVAGVEVFHGDVKVLLARDLRPIGISGTPHPAAHAAAVRAPAGDEAAAVAAALGDRHGVGDRARVRAVEARGGWRRYELAGDARMVEPARVKPVYFPIGEALVPATLVELQTRDARGHSVFQYVIGDDGRVLYRHDATAFEAHAYRVWADEGGDHRPADGPLVDYTPHPRGVPDVGPTEAAPSVLITTEGFHSLGDPWLAPGAGETRGNNVDAYVDWRDPSGLKAEDGEFRGAVSSPGVFDWTYDVGEEPLATPEQSMAALVQLFYVNNWMHDWWYDSGFDEQAGNAQADNYGRGGQDGDVLLAEGQDAALEGTRNNANMSTPMDGGSPRMQMYLWTGLYTEAKLTLDTAGLEFTGGLAKFGPKSYGVKGTLVRFEDGAGASPTDGCEAPIVDMQGKIAVVDRGDCTFETKVTFAGQAGALGVVIIDNVEADAPIEPGNDNDLEDPPVPTLAVTQADGATVLAAMEKEEQFVHMTGWSSVERDGTVDNMIIAHEWGHYLHHRLTDCGNLACGAMSEGWADFNALMMALREGDDLDGVYAGTTYANFDTAGYYGIRRVPYSVNLRRNALTFRHISDGEPLPTIHPIMDNGLANSESHNAGEVWATMMWEVYVALHKAHAGELGFAEVHRRMGDYVVAGMMLAPPDPTFTEQRDALLMAAAGAPDDFMTIARAFARRGAGSCALSPERGSSTLVGVVEDFEIGASGVLLAASVAEQDGCDKDGVIDPGETGRVTVEVYNGGVAPLAAGAVVEVVDPDPGLVFPQGPSVALPELAPLGRATVTIDVALAEAAGAARAVALRVRLDGEGACAGAGERALRVQTSADVAPASSNRDDVEAEPSAWTPSGGGSSAIWTRAAGDGGYSWRGGAVGHTSDVSLVSPKLEVGDEPLVIAFDHAYSFELTDGTAYDGAVIEVSSDDGATWVDVAELGAEPGYGGKIASGGNALNGRDALIGASPGFPARARVELDLGTALAGKTALLRFRIGTDGGVGGPGWDIDDIAVTGITNTPFPTWVDDPGCDEGGSSGMTGDSEDVDGSDGTSSYMSDDDGCGCASGGSGAAGVWLLLGLRRRRRARGGGDDGFACGGAGGHARRP